MRTQESLLYEAQYLWFIFVSSLDLMLTWMILYLGGYEANPVASYILNEHGIHGMVAFKMGLVVFVILLCEWIGRRSVAAGRRLANASVAITLIPVIVAFSLLLR